MSFVTCPSCGKTAFIKDSGECPNCGVMLEAGTEAGPAPSTGHGEHGTQRISCLVAGIAAAVLIMGIAVFVVMAARG